MKIVHFRLDHPVLHEALQRVPGMEIEWIRSDVFESEHRIQVLFWATGGDFEAFEAGLEDDPTVTSPSLTDDIGERRLYQLDVVDEGFEKSVYPHLVEQGCVIQHLTATDEGWDCRIGFLDESSVSKLFARCESYDINAEIYCMFDVNECEEHAEYGLTTPQRETLVAALEIGYLDIPRAGTLQELGNRCGVSDTAASQRVRRGVKTLIKQTIYRGTETTR